MYDERDRPGWRPVIEMGTCRMYRASRIAGYQIIGTESGQAILKRLKRYIADNSIGPVARGRTDGGAHGDSFSGVSRNAFLANRLGLARAR